MKTLMITMMIMTGCGAGADHLATSIDNATTAATATSDSSSDAPVAKPAMKKSKAKTDVTVNVNVNVNTGADSQDVPSDLDGTAWTTKCDNGVSYRSDFAKGVQTLTTNIYSDSKCAGVAQSVSQHLTYAVDGDDIQFNEGAAGVYLPGQPFQTITFGEGTVTFSGNAEQIWYTIAE